MLDLESYFRFALALAVVLGLIAGAGWLLRRYGFEGTLAKARQRGRRLTILEIRAIDPRHKLVLFSRDEVEHLIVVGPHGETLIESGFQSTQYADANGTPKESRSAGAITEKVTEYLRKAKPGAEEQQSTQKGQRARDSESA